jgi:hypothetical protein
MEEHRRPAGSDLFDVKAVAVADIQKSANCSGGLVHDVLPFPSAAADRVRTDSPQPGPGQMPLGLAVRKARMANIVPRFGPTRQARMN